MLTMRVLVVLFVAIMMSSSTSPAYAFAPSTTRVMQRKHRRATRPQTKSWRSDILIGALKDSEGLVDERMGGTGGDNTDISEARGTVNGSRGQSSTTQSGSASVSLAGPGSNVQNSAPPPFPSSFQTQNNESEAPEYGGQRKRTAEHGGWCANTKHETRSNESVFAMLLRQR